MITIFSVMTDGNRFPLRRTVTDRGEREERYLRGPSFPLLPFAQGKLVERTSGEVVVFSSHQQLDCWDSAISSYWQLDCRDSAILSYRQLNCRSSASN